MIRFFAALEAGDIDSLREIYAPDAVIWHNDDLVEQPVDENLKVLQGLHRAVSGLRYDVVRRVPAPDGVLQQNGSLTEGTKIELQAAKYMQVQRWAHHTDRGVTGLRENDPRSGRPAKPVRLTQTRRAERQRYRPRPARATAAVIAWTSGSTATPATRTVGVAVTPAAVARAVT